MQVPHRVHGPKTVVTPTQEARHKLHRHFSRMPKPRLLTTTTDFESRLSFPSARARQEV
jgi:hypothetical protein